MAHLTPAVVASPGSAGVREETREAGQPLRRTLLRPVVGVEIQSIDGAGITSFKYAEKSLSGS